MADQIRRPAGAAFRYPRYAGNINSTTLLQSIVFRNRTIYNLLIFTIEKDRTSIAIRSVLGKYTTVNINNIFSQDRSSARIETEISQGFVVFNKTTLN